MGRDVIVTRVSRLAVLAVAGVLAACTSGRSTVDATPSRTARTAPTTSSPTPSASSTSTPVATDDGLVVVDAGAEPRSDLSMTDTLDATVAIAATSSGTSTLDGDTRETASSADYRVAVRLEPSDGAAPSAADDSPSPAATPAPDTTPSPDNAAPVVETHVLTATPELVDVDIAGPVPNTLGYWEWNVDGSGTILGMDAREWTVPVHPDLRELLTFSHLVLEVPDVPVGTGARWTRELDDGTLLDVVLDDVADDTVAATSTVTADVEGGRLDVTVAGTWERTTLVAVDVTATTEESASGDVVVDGTPTTMNVTRSTERRLVREEA